MSYEDILKGAANAFTLHYAYINNVGKEIGIDKAEEISADVCRMMGSMRGKIIKENADLEQFTPEAAAAAARGSIEEDFGIITKLIEEGPDRIVYECRNCPVYDGAYRAGMDPGSIEAQCRYAPVGYMEALVRELNPNLSYRLRKFRTSADDTCEEEIVLG
ncbi:MAG TPA: hypothetical protein ENO22_03445 [candidate division Zixibacteria bacterium]|nr:hypothetical protein [candidate division Zixibacteria bacterium]